MLFNYVFILFFILIVMCFVTTYSQTSSTGKINSGVDSSSALNPGVQIGQDVSNNGYQYNQGVQPYVSSYGYNTGIRPYSYSYTYPQNGGKPQITYQNLQQPQAQPQFPGIIPMQPAYYGQNGYPQMQTAYYGYPPLQPVQFHPMPINGPQPTIPPIPDLSSLGGDFDLSNLNSQPKSQGKSANNGNDANNQLTSAGNPLSDLGLDSLGATNADSNNNNAVNGLQPPDLNAELANLADPGSNDNSNSANNNNALSSGVPQGLADFGIEGLGSSPSSNKNKNNPMSSFDILNQFGEGDKGGQNDFSDLTNLANLANGNLGNSNPTPSQTTNAKSSTNPENGNLDFNMNSVASASNLDFDLNIPSPSEIKPQKVKSNKEIATTKNKKKSIKKNKIDNQNEKSTKSDDKKLVKNLKRRSLSKKVIIGQSNQLESAESFQNQNHLIIDPESPRGMLNINSYYQNPYQGVYSQWPGYRL